MKRVFAKMFLALVVTAVSAWFVVSNETILMFLVQNSWAYWALFLAEIGMVFSISARINKLSERTATLLFYLYSIINGVALSVILLVYTLSTIYQTFLIAAVVFGVMSLYGFFTKNDLTKIGSFLYMALIGLVAVIVVNIFFANSMLDWIISLVGVAIFVGLTAYDTQNIKRMALECDSSQVGRIATIGALSLYLDFINLFIYLLRFFGGSRD